jgi:hypothetical protein
MAGYNGYSKSNNAIEAENDHKFSLTNLCRIYGLKKDSIENEVNPCEWHHSSKYFNIVNYYDARDCVRSRNIRDLTTSRPSPTQLYNRMVVKISMIKEAAGYQRFTNIIANLKIKMAELEKKIDAIEKNKETKAQAKREAAEAVRQAALQAQRQKAQSDYKFRLYRRCQATGVNIRLVKEALNGAAPVDPCCMKSQIRKWFAGYENSVDEIMAIGA